MLEVDNTVVIKPLFDSMYSSNYGKLVIDCPLHSNIIISIIEELGEEDGERKAILIQVAGLKDDDKRRFEL